LRIGGGEKSLKKKRKTKGRENWEKNSHPSTKKGIIEKLKKRKNTRGVKMRWKNKPSVAVKRKKKKRKNAWENRPNMRRRSDKVSAVEGESPDGGFPAKKGKWIKGESEKKGGGWSPWRRKQWGLRGRGAAGGD